jgi:replicative DNA helicase
LLATLNQPLPFSDEAEKGVISCLLQWPAKADEAPPPEAFYHPSNRELASLIIAMVADGRPVDIVSLTHCLRDRGKLDHVGGPAAISELYDFAPIVSHFSYFCGIVRDKHASRSMISALVAGIAALQAVSGVETASQGEIMQTILQSVCEAGNDDGTPELKGHHLSDLIRQVLEDAENQSRSQTLPGVTTGMAGIDAVMGGMEPGCLTIIAAESSDGKSSLARQWLEAAADAGHCSVLYTYEMPPKTESRRVLCSQASIDGGSMKRGTFTRGDQQSLNIHVPKASRWDFTIIDAAGKTVEQICRDISLRAKRLPKGKKLIACIDYIQLCRTSMQGKNSREREVAHITATAKQCAKLTGAHIIMPSQVNKEGDVRESMAIEQDADTLIQIQKMADSSNAKKPAWKQAQEPKDDIPDNRRNLFFKKLRDGERFKKLPHKLVGKHFRFEPIDDNNIDDML